MTQLASEYPIATPSRPPPGSLRFEHLDLTEQKLPPVGETLAPAPEPVRRPRSRWPLVAGFLALGCAFSTLAFAALQSSPYAIERATSPARSAAQVATVEAVAAQRWLIPEVRVVLDDSLQKLGPDADQAIVQAFGAWLSSSPNLPELSIENGSGLRPKLDPDGVNAVMYAPIEFPGHEDDLAITIGFSDEGTGEITEADIIINSRHVYGNLSPQSPGAPTLSCDGTSQAAVCDYHYDLQNVMTHEVGHFYGLGEDRVDRTATMYSCTSACETHKRDLSSGDQQLISKLYEAGSHRRAELMSCNGAQLAPRGSSTSWLGAGAVLLMSAFERRRRAAKRARAALARA